MEDKEQKKSQDLKKIAKKLKYTKRINKRLRAAFIYAVKLEYANKKSEV